MIIDYEDDGVIRWERNGEKKRAELIDLIEAYEDKQKHGRWIVCDDLYKTIDGRVFDGYRECSVCGEIYPYFPEHNYCPNCGADMREVENDSM